MDNLHTMRVIAIGFSRMAGTAKASGNQYDMCRLQILLPQTSARTQSMERTAAGFQASELEVDSSRWHQFVNIPYPAHIDVQYVEELVNFKGRAEPRRKLVGVAATTPIALIATQATPTASPSPSAAPKVAA
ncbi:hypothetical protein [Chitinimonas lacunae]|uniref:Uncharacterized protein n=1 Tax=Chitinimonas lacunae TaxID=1963018 RepID=A0ABV8MMV3_9NEIS